MKITAISLDSPKSPTFVVKGAPLMHAVLNMTDLCANNNKFFSIELQESTNAGFRIFTHYGRVGSSGAKDGRYFTDKYSAEHEYENIIKKKLAKGYIKIEIAKSSVGSDVAQKIVNITELPKSKNIIAKTALSKRESNVQDFVTQIYADASNALKTSFDVTITDTGVQTPLGALSQQQIDKAKLILGQIRKHTTLSPSPSRTRELIQLSGAFFSNVPRRLPPFPKPEEIAILTEEKASKEAELLDLMQDVFDMKDGAMTSDVDNKYAALKTEIATLDSNSAEFMRILKYVKGTESRHHNVNIHINKIYSLKLNADYSRFNPKNITPVKELFHGSRNANILGILTKGLLIAPANVPSTGYMFGRGLYFANRSTKSTQYSVGRYNGGNNGRDNAFLFLADVAVGKMKEYDSGHYQDYAPHGYDSVKGVAGRQLLHDEFIVYNVSQARIKYVVDFKLK